MSPEAVARQYLQAGDGARAAQLLADLVQAYPYNAQLWHDLGAAYLLQGKNTQAELPLRKALELKPDFLDALVNLGIAVIDLGRTGEGLAIFQHANALKPDHIPILNNLGRALNRMNRSAEALPYFHRALELDHDCVEVLHNLGIGLGKLDRFDEAIEAYRRVLALKPEHYFTYNSLGNALRNSGRLHEAIVQYEFALQHKPDYAEARLGRALAWLALGELEKGWPEYEWRLRFKEFFTRPLDGPRWDGSPLNGRTILLLADQGLGDVIQFVRYVPLVKKAGGRVIQECPAPLLKIFGSLHGVDQFIARGSTPPAFDVHLPLASLPHLFHTRLDTIPADVPYLHAVPGLVERWAKRLDELARDASKGFTIGVAWQGEPRNSEDRRRSFPLQLFAAIATVPDVRLVSLQKGFGTEQIKSCGFPITHFGLDLDEAHGPFMDTAAIMKNLDLVITADTATAHLAGALGVPVWIPLPFVPDWRWFRDRSDSPWYPTARLFRQPKSGDWSSVFAEMSRELRRLLTSSLPGEVRDEGGKSPSQQHEDLASSAPSPPTPLPRSTEGEGGKSALLTREQVRALDRRAIDEIGIPSLVLMENAGRGAADVLVSLGIRGPVLVCCGKGNNGGDGLVLARHLALRRLAVKVALFAQPAQLSTEAAVHWKIVNRLQIPTVLLAEFDEGTLRSELQGCDWVVDALFGTGLTGAVREPFDRVIECINAGLARILALDIPSGLDADTGTPMGPTIRATHTVTFAASKVGFANPEALVFTGPVTVADIGVLLT